MRLAPAVVRFHADREAALAAVELQGRTTHGAQSSVESCRLFAGMLWDALNGMPKKKVLAPRDGGFEHPAVAALAAGSWRKKKREEIRSSGFVVDTLEAALWSFEQADGFEQAVLLAANLGDDADTVAAVCGQLAGAFHGRDGIPAAWLEVLAWRGTLVNRAARLWLDGAEDRRR